MRLATFLMRSGLPTEVPPYFCTNKAICLNTLFTFEANPYLTWQRVGRKLGSGQFADISGRAALLPVRRKKTSLTSPQLCHYLGSQQYFAAELFPCRANRRAKGLLQSACPNTGVGNRRIPYTYQEHLNLNWHFANTDEFCARYVSIFIPVKVGVAIYTQFGQEIELDLSRME